MIIWVGLIESQGSVEKGHSRSQRESNVMAEQASDVAISQSMLVDSKSQRGKKQIPLENLEGTRPADTLIFAP